MICVNSAEEHYLDSGISIDSLLTLFPCLMDNELSPLPDGVKTGLPGNRKEQNSVQVAIYPNPAGNEVYVQALHDQAIRKIQIINVQGILIQEITFDTQLSESIIDLKSISSGTYIITVETDKTVSRTPFIIAR